MNQDDSEQNDVDGMKKGADSTADAYVKERLVICNEEDTDGRARVTRDEVWHRMLYSCTHMVTVGIKGLTSNTALIVIHEISL